MIPPIGKDIAIILDFKDLVRKGVVVNGKLTFTVDSLETMFDHQIEIKHLFEEQGLEKGIERKVFVGPMFNDDPEFGEFLRDLTIDVMKGKGDIEFLR